jgi:ABC-type lipoprotein export system ATPase subunit
MDTPSTTPQPVLEAFGVERHFGSGDKTVHVLRGVDLSVPAGALIALYGPSGSGKTTLLNLLGALDAPSAGSIHVLGSDITRWSENRRAQLRRYKLGFIFQNYTLMPTYTAAENIDMALRLAGYGWAERRRRTQEALAAVGLSAWSTHLPDELSGGQRQRVAIARALAPQPALVFADEPTSGLDTRTTRRILGLFRRAAAEHGTTFVIVSHDALVTEYVDAAYDLLDGKLIRRSVPAQPLESAAQNDAIQEEPAFLAALNGAVAHSDSPRMNHP